MRGGARHLAASLTKYRAVLCRPDQVEWGDIKMKIWQFDKALLLRKTLYQSSWLFPKPLVKCNERIHWSNSFSIHFLSWSHLASLTSLNLDSLWLHLLTHNSKLTLNMLYSTGPFQEAHERAPALRSCVCPQRDRMMYFACLWCTIRSKSVRRNITEEYQIDGKYLFLQQRHRPKHRSIFLAKMIETVTTHLSLEHSYGLWTKRKSQA